MADVTSVCDRVVKWGLVALLVFTPFAFGTVEQWSQAFMEWAVIALFLVFALGWSWQESRSAAGARRWTGLEPLIAAFLVFGALQTIPLPPSWLAIASPGSVRMYDGVDLQRWPETSGVAAGTDPKSVALLALAPKERRPVSVQPQATWDRLEMLAALGVVFVLVALWAERPDRIVFLIGSVVTVGFLVAVQALVQRLTWNGKVLWFRKIPPSSPFGPFVNHNHFAGYVEMIIPVAISLALSLVETHIHRRPELPPAAGRASIDAFLDRQRDGGGHLGKAVLSLFAAVMLVVTLFFSLSWGGIISTAVSGLVFFLLVGQRLVRRSLAWAVAAAIPPLVLGLVLWIGADEVKSQLGPVGTASKEGSFGMRVMIWDSLVRNLGPYVWLGAGLGTFEVSFAPVSPPGSTGHWDRAHNDYLQILWEGGLVGLLLVLAAVFTFVKRYWWAALRSRGHPLDLFRVGLAVSLLSIALHSVVDFNLQIGANGFLCALLAGILIALHHFVEDEKARRPVLVSPSR